KYSGLQLKSEINNDELLLAIAEGCVLSNYQFLKYKSSKEKHSLTDVTIVSKQIKKDEVKELEIVLEAVCKARDLVNEPQSYLNAPTFAEEMKTLGKKAGFKTQVLNKK